MGSTREYTAGAYKILYGSNDEYGTDLGWSEDPPRITFFSGGEWQMLTVDQFGSLPLDAIFKSVEQIRITFASVNFTNNVLNVALRSIFDSNLTAGGKTPLIPRYPAGAFAIKDSLWQSCFVTPFVEAGSLASWEFFFHYAHPVGICDIPLASSRVKKLPMELACLPKLVDVSEGGDIPDGWPKDATLIPNFGYIKNLAEEGI